MRERKAAVVAVGSAPVCGSEPGSVVVVGGTVVVGSVVGGAEVVVSGGGRAGARGPVTAE
jgi:hypothetical protein